MKKGLPLLLSCFLLYACAPWPPHGTGGMAERSQSPVDQSYFNSGHIAKQRKLHHHLMACRNAVASLDVRGAQNCYPGIRYKMQLQDNRITRQIAGGLFADAYDDLAIFDNQIKAMKHRMSRVRNSHNCTSNNAHMRKAAKQIKHRSTAHNNNKKRI